MVPSDYDSLRRKGVDGMIAERDEEGFFERVVTVHPLASRRRILDLDATHRIYEYPLGLSVRAGASLRHQLMFPFGLLWIVVALIRIARAERIDLVRANDPYLMGLMGWCVARVLQVPLCVSLHADYEKRFRLAPKRRFGAWLRRLAAIVPRFVIPRADRMLPIREHMVDWIVRMGAAPAAIRLIPHGIDMARFITPGETDVRALFDIPADAKVVSFVGRLDPDNYASDLVDIVERVLALRSEAVFLMIGEGSAETECRVRLSDGNGRLVAGVRLSRFQPFDIVADARRLSIAGLCLMGGLSLIEACAAGCAIVSYDVEWHQELVRTGVTGFLVKEHDIEGAVAAILEILDDPDRAAAMGAEAQRLAFSRHDIRATSMTKRHCYAELLATRQATAT